MPAVKFDTATRAVPVGLYAVSVFPAEPPIFCVIVKATDQIDGVLHDAEKDTSKSVLDGESAKSSACSCKSVE